MKPDAAGRGELSPAPEDLAFTPGEIARLARCGPAHRWERELLSAVEEARSLIRPHARWSALSEVEMGGLFPGHTPVESIARRGRRWGFVATVGSALEERVKEHFGDGDYLRGVLLDAAGSAAVEAVCDVAERTCAGKGPSTRFSPGYCMWILTGQIRLFELLRPGEVGVRLLPSMLMSPLKSASGIIVRAGAAELNVPAEACRQCDAAGCTRRSAAQGGE